MRTGLTALLVMVLAAGPSAGEESLRGRAPVELPAYEAAGEDLHLDLYATPAEYAAAASDPRYRLERIVYESGGIDVSAYLYTASGGGARPTVVFNRGSYVRGAIAPELVAMFHRLGEHGFNVVAPMYRGSDGMGGSDEMGGGDLEDLMQIAALSEEIAEIDARRLYLYGESRGGMMVYQAIRDGFPARAAAVFGTFTDLDALIAAAPDVYVPLTATIWPDFDARRGAIVARRSAQWWPERIATPLLIMHGGADADVPPSQALDMASALEREGADYRLVVFGGEGHLVAGAAAERDAAAAAWFRAHAD